MSTPYISLLLPTKDRYELLVRMLESVEVNTVGIPWEALILYAEPGDKAELLQQRFPQVTVFDQADHFPPGRPTWPAMMQFLLQKATAPWFMYASDDIVFRKNSIAHALNALNECEGLAGGVAMAYRNAVAATPPWSEYGVDLTLGDQVLVNYGFLSTPLCKSLGGFSDEYKFYCADGDICLRVLESGYRIIPCLEAKVLHDNVLDQLKQSSNELADADIATYRKIWTSRYYPLQNGVRRLLPNGHVSDTLLPQGEYKKSGNEINGVPNIEKGEDALFRLHQASLYVPGKPMHLHLGCAENNLDGYVNVGHATDRDSAKSTKADVYANIKELRFPDNTLDEIRLNNIFERFNRVEALGFLIRCHRWLKSGGTIYIETPDLAGSAKTLLSTASFKDKMTALRHLAGIQTETGTCHLDLWFPERFHVTLSHMGFGRIETKSEKQNSPPHLYNVTATGVKKVDVPTLKLLQAAEDLLWLSTKSDSEIATYELWKKQLRNFLKYKPIYT
ncbi:hypothetical protein [Desulfovibrio sp. JC010]|uniref:hypothetical protein n=1 Tax=Desulfovibrio sp. JC010 TaxID=2593641 RepID=UPI0013D8B152|nr:hypothetical protein [Desulfovibrio sp. JC010]NDV26679.1 hypothetical protein [Desulfovibrio sp. JC010]